MNPKSLIKRVIRVNLKRLGCLLACLMTAASGTAAAEIAAAVTGRAREDVQTVRRYAAQLREQNRMEDYAHGGFTWDTERRQTSWGYPNGFMLDAMLRLDREESIPLAEAFFRDNILEDGSVRDYADGSVDSVQPARALQRLIPDSAEAERYRAAIQWIYSRLENQRKYPACGNNYLHVQNENGRPAAGVLKYPIFLDGLYMTQPFLARCAADIRGGQLTLTDREGAAVSAEDLEAEILRRYTWVQAYLYDGDLELYQHAWDVSGGKGNGHYWGRGIGWLAISMADVIEILPEGPGRERIKGILVQLLDGMLIWQDDVSGMWYNVVNRGEDLPENRTETSVTAMMAYALVKAWNGGYAPGDHYLEKGMEAFHAVIRDKAEIRDGEIHIRDTYLKSGVGDTDEYYCREGYTTDEAKGTAALIMAAAEIEKAIGAYTGE